MAVMCTVNNCHYWDQGNRCAASSILIVTDKLAETAPDSFDAMQASNAQATPAKNCMDTACKTFVHRDVPEITDDHVTKRIK